VSYDDLQESIRLLDQATRTDPGFADGWSLLSRAQSDHVERLREFDGREADAEEAAALAERALLRAQELAPGSAAALKAEGFFHQTVKMDPVAALRSFDRALAVLPNDPETLLFQAFMFVGLGQLDRAVANIERAYEIDNTNGLIVYGLTSLYEASHRYADMVPFYERLVELEPEKTHPLVEARYFQFLNDGSIASFEALEKAVREIPRTEQCNIRSVQNREMTVAMFNDAFAEYAAAWAGKWDRHYAGHGDWACPGIINDEANQARLLLEHGEPAQAQAILEKARASTMRPYTEMSFCIFDRDAFLPKLDFLGGDAAAARREFDAAIPGILRNDTFPRGAVERAVLLETADLVAPDRVYELYREIVAYPISLVSLATVCANPWTFPNLLRDPRFLDEVRADGRFVAFLEHQGVPPTG
jgi:tetratricopeptide (TPR) repeat protein